MVACRPRRRRVRGRPTRRHSRQLNRAQPRGRFSIAASPVRSPDCPVAASLASQHHRVRVDAASSRPTGAGLAGRPAAELAAAAAVYAGTARLPRWAPSGSARRPIGPASSAAHPRRRRLPVVPPNPLESARTQRHAAQSGRSPVVTGSLAGRGSQFIGSDRTGAAGIERWVVAQPAGAKTMACMKATVGLYDLPRIIARGWTHPHRDDCLVVGGRTAARGCQLAALQQIASASYSHCGLAPTLRTGHSGYRPAPVRPSWICWTRRGAFACLARATVVRGEGDEIEAPCESVVGAACSSGRGACRARELPVSSGE